MRDRHREKQAWLPPLPEDFLWGVGISSLQNDGAVPTADWYPYERWGPPPETSALNPDFRGHLSEDLDRAAYLGINAFRADLDWARLEPLPGQYDPDEIAFVHQLLDELEARSLTPIMTLHHLFSPRWTAVGDRRGRIGWQSPDTVEAFWRFVDFVGREFGRRVRHFITFNEPDNKVLGGYLAGKMPPQERGPHSAWQAHRHIWLAHQGAYELLHRHRADAMVSLSDYTCRVRLFGRWSFDYRPGLRWKRYLERTADPASRYLDFLAVQYYGVQTPMTALSFPIPAYDLAVDPRAFGRILEAYHQAFDLPILVAENGFATCNGISQAPGWDRERYLIAHVEEMQRLAAEGVPLCGYLYWTLTDNYEWGSTKPRFGLWRVELADGDLVRHATPSVEVYRRIVRQRGVSPQLHVRFFPERQPAGV